jgi:hypothetical protein
VDQAKTVHFVGGSAMGLGVNVKKKSGWEFVTFGGGGLSAGALLQGGVSGGTVVLKDLQGKEVSFYYGGAGVGIGGGLKLPKLGRVNLNNKGGTLGPTAFPSTGTLYVTDQIAGDDVTQGDLQGLCCWVEVGGGLLVGASGTAMLLGMNPAYLALCATPVTMSVGTQLLAGSAKAVLLMAGINAGLQAGGGAIEYFGLFM